MRTRSALLRTALALLLAASGGLLRAEPEGLGSPSADFPSAMGAFGSSMNGGGLSYQRWFGDLGVAATAGAYALPAEGLQALTVSSGGEIMNIGYNLEVDLLYRLFASDFWNWLSGDLMVYGCLAYKGAKTAEYVFNPDKDDATDDSYYKPGELEQALGAGVGIGYEIVLFRHFSLPLMFGYQVEWPFRLDFNFSGGLRYRYR